MSKVRYTRAPGVLYIRNTCDADTQTILSFIHKIGQSQSLPRKLLILGDARNIETTKSIGDLRRIVDALIHAISKYQHVANAIIVNKPRITAYAVLVGNMIDSPIYHHQVFSTKPAAMEWLELQSDYE